MTPAVRFLRTLVQVLGALAVAIPSAIVLVPIPDKYQGYVALVVGIMGGAVVLVSAVVNALEASTGSPLLLRNATATGVVPVAPVAAPTSPTVDPGPPARGPP